MTIVDNYTKIKLKAYFEISEEYSMQLFRDLIVLPLPGKNLEVDSYSTGD